MYKSYNQQFYVAGGGGSGGSVLIRAGSIYGDATVSAAGGNPAGSASHTGGLSGGGGGGRIGILISGPDPTPAPTPVPSIAECPTAPSYSVMACASFGGSCYSSQAACSADLGFYEGDGCGRGCGCCYKQPTSQPTFAPSSGPTVVPGNPSALPVPSPTMAPVLPPTPAPSVAPLPQPTAAPTSTSMTALPSAVTTSASGGTDSSAACGGSAGTIFVQSGAEKSLLVNSENTNRDDDTYTPLPVDGDLDTVDVSIRRMSHVKISDESTGFHVGSLWLDSTSQITGDTLKLSAHNASLQGDVESSSHTQLVVVSKLRLLRDALLECTDSACSIELEAGTLVLDESTDIQGDVLDLVVGGHAIMNGAVDIEDSVTIRVNESLTLKSTSEISAEGLVISAGSVIASGDVAIVESLAVTATDYLNVTREGALACSDLMCTLQLRSHDMCLDGPVTGGDINVTSRRGMRVSATISADAMGYGAEAGDGNGESINSWTNYVSSSTTQYIDEQSSAGSGAGHGGNGGDSCWQGARRCPSLPFLPQAITARLSLSFLRIVAEQPSNRRRCVWRDV